MGKLNNKPPKMPREYSLTDSVTGLELFIFGMRFGQGECRRLPRILKLGYTELMSEKEKKPKKKDKEPKIQLDEMEWESALQKDPKKDPKKD